MDLAPKQDQPDLGGNKKTNNAFMYDLPGDFESQDRCPFAAHIRKTNPRNDLAQIGQPVAPSRIARRGIPFGPEVSEAENESGRTAQDRGLLFKCYQSSIANGFQFIQKSRIHFHKAVSMLVTHIHDTRVG